MSHESDYYHEEDMHKDMTALRAENAMLRDALGFYANPLNWFSDMGSMCAARTDNGGRARSALGDE